MRHLRYALTALRRIISRRSVMALLALTTMAALVSVTVIYVRARLFHRSDFRPMGDRVLITRPLNDIEVASLRGDRDVYSGDIYDEGITHATMAILPTMPKLMRLGIGGSNLDSDGFRAIAKCEFLGSLRLYGEEATDERVQSLSRLRNLFSLTIQNGRCTGRFLESWPTDTRLSVLRIEEAHNDDVSLRGVRNIKSLEWLELNGSNVGDEEIAALNGALQLVSIDLSNTKVTDGCAATLLTLKNVRFVNLHGTGVTDTTLETLATHEALRELDVSDTQVSRDAIASFRKRRPRVSLLTPSIHRP